MLVVGGGGEGGGKNVTAPQILMAFQAELMMLCGSLISVFRGFRLTSVVTLLKRISIIFHG